MTYQHRDLANGRWQNFSLVEQLANVGSEVHRAIEWKNKNNPEYSQKAMIRGLELLWLSKAVNKDRVKELARIYECLVDYFWGENIYNSTDEAWQKYFYQFNYAARNK